MLFYNEFINIRQNSIQVCIFLNIQCKILGKIQTKNTHDGLRINDVSVANQIEIIIIGGNDIDKTLYLVNGIDVYGN